MNPDIRYPDILKRLGNLKGGIRYRNTDDSNTVYVFGDVVDVDLHNLDPSVHADFNTALRKELMTFNNNTALMAFVWAVDAGGRYQVRCKMASVNKSTSNIIFNFDPYGTGIMAYGQEPNTIDVELNLAKTYGAKFYFYTDYYDNVILPYPGEVPFRITLDLKFPCVGGDAVVNLSNFVSDAQRYGTVGYFDVDSPMRMLCLDYAIGAGVICGPWIDTNDIDAWLTTAFNGGGTNPYEVGEPTTEPTQEGDPSVPGGGEGNYDDTSDPIDFPDNPTNGALDSGAIKAFSANNQIITSMFNKLWDSSIFDIPLQFQKLVDNPMDCVISLHAVPVLPTVGSPAEIILGNFHTQVTAGVITSQYVTIDCGSLAIKEYWGSALDYSPYTKCEIYLPFVGIKQLNIDDVMKNTVHIKYNVDIFTGDCMCFVKCGQSVLYTFSGNLKMDIPLTGRANNMGIKGMLGATAAFAGGMMGGAVGGPVGAAMGVGSVLSAAASVASSKIITTRSGSLAGSVGLLGDFVPYFILHRPVQSLANKFKTFKGYPSNITRQLSSVSGYTEVEYINLQNIPDATQEEMDEIKMLLGKGVLI